MMFTVEIMQTGWQGRSLHSVQGDRPARHRLIKMALVKHRGVGRPAPPFSFCHALSSSLSVILMGEEHTTVVHTVNLTGPRASQEIELLECLRQFPDWVS